MGAAYERYLAEQQQQKQQPQPSASSLYDEYQASIPATAVGNMTKDQQSTQDVIARLQKVVPANEAHRQRLERMIQNLQATLPHGPLGMVRGQSDLTNPTESLKQVVSGAGAGALEGLMQPADVALALPDRAVSLIPGSEGNNPFHWAREKIKEATANVEEEFNPEGSGAIGAISNLAGNIATSTPGFGTMSKLAAAKILKYLPNSAIAGLITRASEKGAPILTRAAASVASGLPIQISVAAGSDGPWQQRLTQLGIGIGADALFGGIFHGGEGEQAKPAEGPAPERAAQLKEAQERAQAKSAAELQLTADRRQSRAEWQVANPDKDWKSLDKMERKQILKDYQDRRASHTNLDKGDTGEGVAPEPGSAPPSVEQTAPVGGEVAPGVEAQPTDEAAAGHVALAPITPQDHADMVEHLNDLVEKHDAAVERGNEAEATDLSHQAQVVAATLDGSVVQEPHAPNAQNAASWWNGLSDAERASAWKRAGFTDQIDTRPYETNRLQQRIELAHSTLEDMPEGVVGSIGPEVKGPTIGSARYEPTAAEQLAQPSPVAALRDKVAGMAAPPPDDAATRVHQVLVDYKAANPKEIGPIPSVDDVSLWMQGDPRLTASRYAQGGMQEMMNHFMALKRAGVDIPVEYRDEVAGRLMHFDGDPLPAEARPAVQKGWRDAEQDLMPGSSASPDAIAKRAILERVKDKTKEDLVDEGVDVVKSTGFLGTPEESDAFTKELAGGRTITPDEGMRPVGDAAPGVKLLSNGAGRVSLGREMPDGSLAEVGTLSVTPEGKLEHIAVVPELRGKGLAQQMMAQVESEGHRIDAAATQSTAISDAGAGAINKYLSGRATKPVGAEEPGPPQIPAQAAVEEPSRVGGASAASDQAPPVSANLTGETYLKSIKSKKALETLSDQQLRLLGKSLTDKLANAEPEAIPAIKQDIANIRQLLGMKAQAAPQVKGRPVSDALAWSPDEGGFDMQNSSDQQLTPEQYKEIVGNLIRGVNNATTLHDDGVNQYKAYDLSGEASPASHLKVAAVKSLQPLLNLWDDALNHIVELSRERFVAGMRRPVFGGISMSQRELGLNLNVREARLAAQQFGRDLNIKDPNNMILMNPFMTYLEISNRAVNEHIDAEEAAFRLGLENWATLTHEVAHQFEGEHNEKFAGAHTRVNAASTDAGYEYAKLFAKEWDKVIQDPDFYEAITSLMGDWHASNRGVQATGSPGTVPSGAEAGANVQQATRGPSLFERIGSRSEADLRGDFARSQGDEGLGASDAAGLDEWGLGSGDSNGSLDFLDTKTFLDTIKHSKALEDMTEPERDRLENKIMETIQSAKPDSPEYNAAVDDLDKLMEHQRWLNVMAGDMAPFMIEPPKEPLTAPVRAPGSDINVEQKLRESAEAVKPPGLGVLRAEPPSKLSPDRLNARIDQLSAYTKGLPADDPMANEYRRILDKALEERAKRVKAVRGAVAQMPPGVFGAAAGFTYGYMSAPDDEDRYTRALEWAAIGAGSSYLLARAASRSGVAEATTKPKELPGGLPQEEMSKYIVHSDARGAKPIPFLERMRNVYQSVVRRSYAVERWQQSIGMARLPVQFNAAKLIAMAGRWAGQTEMALKYGPALVDEFGAIKKLPAMGVADILDIVKGDSDTLGTLMAARTKVELGNSVKTPFTLQQAVHLFNSVPEIYHKAADAARAYSLALADVAVDGGILSKDARDLFANESMYAALQRVFKFSTGSEVSAEKSAGAIAKAVNPIRARSGGSLDAVRNPFEVMVQSTPQFFRAAELNKIKSAMVDAWEAAGKPTEFLRRVGKSETAMAPEHDAQIAELKKMGLAEADAKAMVAGFSAVDELKGTMRVYRNGEIETYKMPPEVATALQTLNAEDIGMLWRVLGVPSRLAAKGITMNPYFVAKMGLYDMWQATLNSQYGFRFGIDNIRGWYHVMRQTPEYQQYLAAGGGHQTLYTNKLGLAQTIESVKGSIGTPLENTVRNLRQMKPIEAYKAMIGPIADAARVGEYLRALDHGESVLQGVWAARQVTANYSEIGSWATMRGLQHATMFLGPALQVLDQAAYRGGIHPFRAPEEGRVAAGLNYATKAFLTITLPSLYFWAANKDDKEINELRQTQTGRKYWFLRAPTDAAGIKKGDIIKLPKPPLDGQVWGTSMESALDQHYKMDPGGSDQTIQAILRDAAFNILPQAGVVPIGLASNYDLGLGRPIIPVGDDELALQYQGADKASWVARAISSKVSPLAEDSKSSMLKNAVTPAGVDFLINGIGGMLGQDAVQAISQAVESNQLGYVPAKEELPLVRRVIATYPSMSTRSIERFYDNSSKVETAAATMTHLIREHPEDAMGYYERNDKLIALAPAYAKQRQTIANMRRAIMDVKNAPASVMNSDEKRALIKQYVQWINDAAGMTLDLTQDQMP